MQQPVATTNPYSTVQPAVDGAQIVFVPNESALVCNKYKGKRSIIVGILQISVAVLLMIFNSVAIAHYLSGPSVTGHCFWAGALYIVTGSFGIAAGRKKTKCPIVAFMVLCIVSAASVIILLLFAIPTAIFNMRHYYCRFDTAESIPSYYDHTDISFFQDHCYNSKVDAVMGICIAVFAILEAIVSIYGSAIGCNAFCCGVTRPMTGVVYQSNPDSQMIIIGQTNQQISFVPSSVQVVPSNVHGQHHTAPPPSHPDGLHDAPPSYSTEHMEFSRKDSMEKPLLVIDQ